MIQEIALLSIALLLVLIGTLAARRFHAGRLLHREQRARARTVQALSESLADGVLVVGPQGVVEHCNRRCAVLLGLRAEEITGRPADELLPANWRELGERGTRAPQRLNRADGSELPVGLVVTTFQRDGRAAGNLVTLSDLSSRLEEEERQRFGAYLLDLLGEAVFAVDPNGLVNSWNRRAAELFGISAEEAMGGELLVLLSPSPSGGVARDQELERLVGSREPWSGELLLPARGGAGFRALVTSVPLHGPSGELTGRVNVAADLTDRIALEQCLFQSRKLEALGGLAGGIAHDFNNLLTAMTGHLELAMEGLPTDEPASESLEVVRIATRRAIELSRRLLAFGRRQELHPQLLHPHLFAERLAPNLRRAIGPSIRLELDCPPDTWTLRTDPALLEQALANVVENAKEAMGDEGVLRIAISNRCLPASAEPFGCGRPMVGFTLADDGRGIPPDRLDRVFEPFYTTKRQGELRGLGLSVVHGFATQSGGFVHLASEAGRGTTVDLLLPRANDHVGGDRRTERAELAAQAAADVGPRAARVFDATPRAAGDEVKPADE